LHAAEANAWFISGFGFVVETAHVASMLRVDKEHFGRTEEAGNPELMF
jgi:hypothetical protein